MILRKIKFLTSNMVMHQLHMLDSLEFFSLAKPEAGKLFIATVTLFIAATSSTLVQKICGKIIDIVSGDIRTPEEKDATLDAINNTILEILLIVIIGSICSALRAWFFYSASERVVARVKKNLFSHLVSQEIAFFDVTRTGELLSRLSEDTPIIKNAATTNLSEALRNLSTAFIGLSFMFATSWKLTLLALAVVPLISVGVRQFGRFLRELSHKSQQQQSNSHQISDYNPPSKLPLTTRPLSSRNPRSVEDEWNKAWESAWLPQDLTPKART